MRQIITRFTDDDLYKFTMCCAVIENFPRAVVRYRFSDRNNTVYPDGFAREVENQIAMLENVQITDAEIEFMKRRCTYIPHWFYSFLKGFRYNRKWVSVKQDSSGHLLIEFEGAWCNTILLEVKVLAIVSELYYMMTGHEADIDLGYCRDISTAKARRLIDAGCTFSDFGTRRRASFAAQQTVVEAMSQCNRTAHGPGRFAGTSNVYLAMKYDLTPIGTMAHELICAMAGIYGPQMANHIAMATWTRTFRGALGTFLYDTYGWRIFSLNFSEDFANMFKGLRVDSGDNLEQLQLIVDKYQSLNIDPRTKQVVFSNALNVDTAIALQQQARQVCIPSFGIGTHFTNDFPAITPLNIVIKMTDIKITEAWPFFCSTCKLSEDKGKYSGDIQTVERFRQALHL